MAPRTELSPAQWAKAVSVAGIGSVLEWFDFYIYTQLSSTLKKAFFPADDPTAQALAYWGVFAAAFVVRPIGALLFGHIADTWGRSRAMLLSILAMAIPTTIIGILPTYGVGSYTASPPILAPIFLAIMRLLQGLAMGGEFGSAIIYVSELANINRRGTLVVLLQNTVNVGMIIATLLVMLLQHTISAENMLIWGWRIPFLLAAGTAVLGYFLRRGLPEPKAFLAAARAEKKALGVESLSAKDLMPMASIQVSSKDIDLEDTTKSAKSEEFELEGETDVYAEEGALSKLHGHSHSSVPIFRLLANNWLGLILHIAFMAWVAGAFYTTVTWLPTSLKEAGTPTIVAQGILIVSLLFNAVGLMAVGLGFDRGLRAITTNAIITVLGAGIGVGVYYGAFESRAAAWCLPCLMQLFIGAAMALVVLPCTRIYSPLERTSGFSFAYNCGYGVLGGLSPLITTSIKKTLDVAVQPYAAPIWLLGLGGVTMIGCVGLRQYAPRLNKPFVGRLE